jgi:hypothetical protein
MRDRGMERRMDKGRERRRDTASVEGTEEVTTGKIEGG